MKILLLLFLVLFLAFLETTFVALHLVLLAVIALGVYFWGVRLFLLALLSGLILDLVKGGAWGMSSLQFLAICLIISLYKNRFQAKKLSFLLPLTFFTVLATDLLTGTIFSIPGIAMNTGLIVVFLPLTKFLVKEEDNQLRV